MLNLFFFRCIELFIWSDIKIGQFEFHFDAIFVIYRFCSTVFGALWSPRFCRGSCQVGYLAPTSWDPPAWDRNTSVSIICKHCLWKGALSDNFVYFFLLTSMFCLFRCIGFSYSVRYLKRAFWLSMWCHFLGISILLSSFGVLWRPRSCRGSCQVGYIVPASWEPPIWNIRTAVCIICKLCLWKATLSDNLLTFFILWTS